MTPPATSDLASELRAQGLRVTPQRRAILATFRGGESDHLTAEEVYARASQELPELARATVYNTLGEFVRAGLLRAVEGLGAVRYDPNLDASHHHFHCLSCGGLFDVNPTGAERIELAGGGFLVERTQILLEGTCPRCRS